MRSDPLRFEMRRMRVPVCTRTHVCLLAAYTGFDQDVLHRAAFLCARAVRRVLQSCRQVRREASVYIYTTCARVFTARLYSGTCKHDIYLSRRRLPRRVAPQPISKLLDSMDSTGQAFIAQGMHTHAHSHAARMSLSHMLRIGRALLRCAPAPSYSTA